jgi:hypothetical protein
LSAVYRIRGAAKAKAFDREGRKGLAKFAENIGLEFLLSH